MKALLFALVILYALTSVTPAAADGIDLPDRPNVTGHKVNSHLPKPKPGQSCHNWKSNGWIVELEYYLDDDGTPIETAYADYLEDFAWYFGQYPGTCDVQPETLGE